MAINQKEESNMGALLDFVNRIAVKVKKEFPDVLVGTLAYRYSRKAPKYLKPNNNVQIQLCSFECCQIHSLDDPTCPHNTPFFNDILAWGEITENLSVWNYAANFQNYLLPLPNLNTLGKNISFLKDNNCIGLLMQGPWNGNGAEFSDLKNYIICKLLWDPSLNEAQLTNEFILLHYPGSESAIRNILKKITEAPKASTHRYCNGTASDFDMTAALGRELVILFADALAAQNNITVKARLEKASVCAWRLLAEPWWISRQKNLPLTEAEPLPKKVIAIYQLPTADSNRNQILSELFSLCERHEVTRVSEGTSVEEFKSFLMPPAMSP